MVNEKNRAAAMVKMGKYVAELIKDDVPAEILAPLDGKSVAMMRKGKWSVIHHCLVIHRGRVSG